MIFALIIGLAITILFLIIVYALFFFNYAFIRNNLNSDEKKYYTILIVNFFIIIITFSTSLLYINVFSKNNSTINTLPVTPMQIDAFNNQFENYNGSRNGKTVIQLMNLLKENAGIYKGEPVWVPSVSYSKNSTSIETEYSKIDDTSFNKYLETIRDIEKSINKTANYNIDFVYSNDGIIEKVKINY